MKRTLITAALALMVAAAAFAGENLAFGKTTVLPEAAIDYAGKMYEGKAPDGAKAIISESENKGSETCYRWRIDFTQPLAVKNAKKIVVTWGCEDEAIVTAGGAGMNCSLFTLNKDDYKLFRGKKLDYKGPKKDGGDDGDKKSILANQSTWFQPFECEYNLESDCTTWTGYTFVESTKYLTGIELYVYIGDGNAKPSKMWVKDVHFE